MNTYKILYAIAFSRVSKYTFTYYNDYKFEFESEILLRRMFEGMDGWSKRIYNNELQFVTKQ